MFKPEVVNQPKRPGRILRPPSKTENVKTPQIGSKNEEKKEIKPICDPKIQKLIVSNGFEEHLSSWVILKRLQEDKLEEEKSKMLIKQSKQVWLDSYENKFISISDVDDKASISDSEMSFT